MTVIAGICSDNFYHQNITPIYTDTNRPNMFISHNVINTPGENIIKIDLHAHVCISICIFRCNNICREGIILTIQLKLSPCCVRSLKAIRYTVRGSI